MKIDGVVVQPATVAGVKSREVTESVSWLGEAALHEENYSDRATEITIIIRTASGEYYEAVLPTDIALCNRNDHPHGK